MQSFDQNQSIVLPRWPSQKAVVHLLIGGLIGLLLWEAWARIITPALIGGPLEPSGLVISLSDRLLGYKPERLTAEVVHWIIGIVGYPALYYIISRSIRNYGTVLDILVVTAFTVFLATRLFDGTMTATMLYFWLVVVAVAATRFINPSAFIADALSWGTFTWFNALGIMAPIAGLPFLLMEWGGQLSFMSYVGHAIFGFVLAVVFEVLQARGSAPTEMTVSDRLTS